MRRGFLNQKLGKRNSRRAELQRAKAELNKITGTSGRSGSPRKTDIVERQDSKSG